MDFWQKSWMSRNGPVLSRTLEAISQMPPQEYATAEMEHSEKVLSISFVADYQPAEVLQPRKQPFNLPAMAVPSQASQILSPVFSIAAMWRDQLYAVPAKF